MLYLRIFRFLFLISHFLHSLIAFIYRNLHRYVVSIVGGKKYFYPRNGDTNVSIEWVQNILEDYYKTRLPDLIYAKTEYGSLIGGYTSVMFKIILEWSNDSHNLHHPLPKSLVVKTCRTDFKSVSQFTRHGRECIVYSTFEKQLNDTSPIIFYSRYSEFSGDFLIVMEDLSPRAISSSKILGNQCFGSVEIPEYIQISEFELLSKTVISIADIHASFWRDKNILNYKFLKGADFLKGKNRAKWEAAMDNTSHHWNILQTAIKTGKTKVKYSNEVITAMNQLISNTSWDNFQNYFDISKSNTPFTLCHGDFHAGNSLWGYNCYSLTPKVFFIDWAEASVVCPISDIAQYFISNVNVDTRRKEEKSLVKEYYNRLISNGVDFQSFTWEECWERYKYGGIERWLQLLTYMANLSLNNPEKLPDDAMKWFHLQVHYFIVDHWESCKQIKGLMTPYFVNIQSL